MFYHILNDICNQHIDTHHHFFLVGSNTYVHLPRLLNFTNHLDDSASSFLGECETFFIASIYEWAVTPTNCI